MYILEFLLVIDMSLKISEDEKITEIIDFMVVECFVCCRRNIEKYFRDIKNKNASMSNR